MQLLQVLDLTDPALPTVAGYQVLGAAATDVAVCKGILLAVSMENELSAALPGTVTLFDISNGALSVACTL